MKKIILLLSVWTLGICYANAQTFTVNSLGGNCDAWYYDVANDATPLTGTLQEAIYRHNQGATFTLIEFDATLNGQTKTCSNGLFKIDAPNLSIDGKGVISFVNSGSNLFELAASNLSIKGINITGGSNGINVNSNSVISGITIEKVVLKSQTEAGIIVQGGASNVQLKDVTATSTGKFGIQFNNFSGTNAIIDNAELSGVSQNGIIVTGNGYSGLTIQNSFIYATVESAIALNDGTGTQVKNTIIGLDRNNVVKPIATAQNNNPASWRGVGRGTVSIVHSGILINKTTGFNLEGNTIVASKGNGIQVVGSRGSSTSKSTIYSNKIGVSTDQSKVIANFANGVSLDNSSYIVIGEIGKGNHITGNGNGSLFLPGTTTNYQDLSIGSNTANMHGDGVRALNSDNIEVYSNIIGVDKTGNLLKDANGVSFGNNHNGVYFNGVSNSIVGAPGKKNIIGNNGLGFGDIMTNDSFDYTTHAFVNAIYWVRHGIQLNDGAAASSNNKIQSNNVGIGADLKSNIANSEDAISILGFGSGSKNNIVGGDDYTFGNILGGSNYGVAIQGSNAVGNMIYSNLIGVVDANGTLSGVPTKEGGIKVQSGTNATKIGDVGKGNIIWSQKNRGIYVLGSGTEKNTIRGNSTSCNTGQAIDNQSGGNKEYGPVYINNAESSLTKISGFTFAATDKIDVYIKDDCNDACTIGAVNSMAQGKKWLATISASAVTSSIYDNQYGNGYWEFNFSTFAGATKTNLVVTATDALGNTSEFNLCVNKVACKAPTSITYTTKLFNLCQGDSASLAYSVVFPTDETAKTHKYKLYKSPNYKVAVDSNTTGAAFKIKTAGYYRVEAYNPNSKEFCSLLSPDSVQVNFGTIPVVGSISLKGGGDICENVKGKIYKVSPFTAGSSFKWTVSGATINGVDSRDSVILDFAAAGNVTLNVVEISKAPFSCQSKNKATLSFAINPTPKPVITGKMELCNLADGVYKVANPGGSSYVWTVNGGTKTAFASSDSIKVKWTATTGTSIQVEETSKFSCKGTSVLTSVTVNPLPVVPTLASLKEVCALDTFTAVISNVTIGNTYSWTSTGATPATATGSSVKFAANKTADSLILVLTSTTNKGCVSLAPSRFAVNVNPLPNPGTLALVPAGNLCQTDTITLSFTPTAGATPTWTSTPAAFLNKALDPLTGSKIRFLADQSATVSVSETFTATGCKTDKADVKSISVKINPKPAKPVITGSESAICLSTGKVYSVTPADSKAEYTWIYEKLKSASVPSGAPTLGANSLTVDFGETNAKIKVVVKSEFGCVSDTSLTKAIVVNGCVFEASIGATSLEDCFGEKVQLRNLSQFNTPGPISYTWDFDVDNTGNATPKTSTAQEPPAVSYSKAGTYRIKLTMKDDILGSNPKFVDDTIITFTVNPLPVFETFDGVTELCSDDDNSFDFSVTEHAGASYDWTIPTGAQITAQSASKNSISVLFPIGTTSGSIKVVETTDKGCKKDTTMDVIINNPPSKGEITATPNKVCENEEVTFTFVGEGKTINWVLNTGTDATIVSDNNSTLQVKMGKQLAVVVAYAISDKGCFNMKDTAMFALTPILLPDTSLLEIQGPHNLCEDESADYTAATSETDLEFSWISGPHTINTATNLQTINVTVGNSGPIILEVSREDGLCKVSDLRYTIRRFEKPVIPTFTNLPTKLCASEDSVQLDFNAIDTVFYSWQIVSEEAREILSSTSGLGKDLDSLMFNVKDNDALNLTNCDPQLAFGVRVSYLDPILKNCYDSSFVASIKVILRLDSLDKLDFSVLDETIGKNRFECNLFDQRFDSTAKFAHDSICGIPSNTYTYDWSDYKLEDLNNDGIKEIYSADIIEGSKTSQFITANWSNEATENKHYYFMFKLKLTSLDCKDDQKIDSVFYELLPSDTVDFKLKQESIVCVDDSVRLDIKNILLPSPSLDSNATYTWYYSGVDTMFTNVGFKMFQETVVNPVTKDTTYLFNLRYVYETSLLNEKYSNYPDYNPALTYEQQQDTLPNNNILGYTHFINPKSELNKWMKIVADPRYCAVNSGQFDSSFVDSINIEVVSRPGVSLAGLYGNVNPFDGSILSTDVHTDSLSVDKIEDKFTLYDTFKRDSTAQNPYIYPTGKNAVTYNWGWVYSKDSIATEKMNVTFVKDKNSIEHQIAYPTFVDRPESVEYILVASQITTSKMNVCSDTAKFRVNIGYNPWIPNIFSPNGDGTFDVWTIRNIDKYPNNKVSIYNRWGTLLLEISGYNNQDKVWNGTVKGEELPTGTYFYVVNYGDGFKEVSGAVSIIK